MRGLYKLRVGENLCISRYRTHPTTNPTPEEVYIHHTYDTATTNVLLVRGKRGAMLKARSYIGKLLFPPLKNTGGRRKLLIDSIEIVRIGSHEVQ